MDRLLFRQWFGTSGEMHTAAEWNRLVDNADAVATEIGAVVVLPIHTSEAGALTVGMAQAMEDCISALSIASGVHYTPFTWAVGDSVSFIDLNRWEHGVWACYKAAGGRGRPEDTETTETLLFRYADWVSQPDGTFSQTVPSILAALAINGVIGLSENQIGDILYWSMLGPYAVAVVGDGRVTVRCVGAKVGGKDLELTLWKIGDEVMQQTVNVTASGWTSDGDGTWSKTVAVPGLNAGAEGVIGYATGDLAGAMAGVAADVIMTVQAAGQITLRASSVPMQSFTLVITAVV